MRTAALTEPPKAAQSATDACGKSWTESTATLGGMRIGLERTTKLLVCWHMGRRNEQHTDAFISKLERATTGHFHLSSDGWKSYPTAIKRNLGHRVDHGVMTEVYGRPINYPISAYSPARIIGA